MPNPDSMRILRDGEELIYESHASYIGGLSDKEKEITGSLVLTNTRLSFEYAVGGLFSKRTENLLNYQLPDVTEVKIDKMGLITKKFMLRVSVNSSGVLVCPSFRIREEDAKGWMDAVSNVIRKRR